jgi:hypothetical protein
MSYSRWGSPGLGWYIYHSTEETLFVSPGCPRDLKGCPLHSPTAEQRQYKNRQCWFSESLSKERAIMLRDILDYAIETWDSPV